MGGKKEAGVICGRAMTEAELVRVLQDLPRASDEERKLVLDEILSRSYSWISRMCLFELQNPDAGLDCVQEAMIEIAKSIGAFQGRSDLKTWMFVIVKRTISRYRTREITHGKRYLLGYAADVSEPGGVAAVAPDEKETTDVLIELSENKYEVLKLVRAWPEKQRYAVLLHYFEDLSISEVAGRLNCSENSCKTHLFRARKKLEKEMQKKGKR